MPAGDRAGQKNTVAQQRQLTARAEDNRADRETINLELIELFGIWSRLDRTFSGLCPSLQKFAIATIHQEEH